MKFSERMGYTKPKEIIQYDSIDKDLKNDLWNILLSFFLPPGQASYYFSQISDFHTTIYRSMWTNSLKFRLDQLRGSQASFKKPVEKLFFETGAWYEIYNLIEDFYKYAILARWSPHNEKIFTEQINKCLSKELSGYRFLNGKFSPITNEEEIKTIEFAAINDDEYKTVTSHLNKALGLLSDKTAPDFNNSIKESVSAIESYFKVFFKDPNISFGNSLNNLENKHGLDKKIKESILRIYGYCNNVGAIRHALKPGETSDKITLAEAKYMLVTCSAFINYLKETAAK